MPLFTFRESSQFLERPPITPAICRQSWAFFAVAARELLWVLPSVAGKVEIWRARALLIPDATIREDALTAIDQQALQRRRCGPVCDPTPPTRPHLLRLLVAFQMILDFLDSVNEPGADPGQANGSATPPGAGGGARSGGTDLRLLPAPSVARRWRLSARARRGLSRGCATLPSYGCVQPLVIGEAPRAEASGSQPRSGSRRRDGSLSALGRTRVRDEGGTELVGADGAASARSACMRCWRSRAEPACTAHDDRDVDAAYLPWICVASTMLDSYVDEVDDAARPTDTATSPTMRALRVAARAGAANWSRDPSWEARRLRNGDRHAVIAACMVAMYLSADSARTPTMRATTDGFVDAGGSLTRVLLPILRLWRRHPRDPPRSGPDHWRQARPIGELVRTEYSEQSLQSVACSSMMVTRDVG